MSDIDIRIDGRAGRITLTRPQALNALTHAMLNAIAAALEKWRADPGVALVIIDAEGKRAFCSGGDIAQMYASGRAGNYSYGRAFWRDEYRLNAMIRQYAKPVITLMQGYTMGGGVGIGCHASHRVVGETSRIALPECSIGLVPDVGSTLLLANAPGSLGAYLGLTGTRLGPGDAIHTGFADHFLPESRWPQVVGALVHSGDPRRLTALCAAPPPATLPAHQAAITGVFSATTLPDLLHRLDRAPGNGALPGDWAAPARTALQGCSPLSLAATLAILTIVRRDPRLSTALDMEFRFTSRAAEHGDFLEGIRARIIDKDNSPHWRHASAADVSAADVAAMLAPIPLPQPQESIP